jgi:uncharacterized protein (TIGR03086 family)
MAIDPHEAMLLANQEFSARLNKVNAGQWAEPSVCDGWTIGDLVDHVIGGNVFTARVLDGATADEAMQSAIDAAVAGQQDRVAAYETSLIEMTQRLAEPGVDARTCHHLGGELTGEVVRGLRIVDVTLHAWDLARSTGVDGELDRDLVGVCWAIVSARIESVGESAGFGDGTSGAAAADAPLIDRLLAVSGRSPGGSVSA